MLECVINVSEGRAGPLLDQLAGAAGAALLDVHRDPDHHRSVFTLGGPEGLVVGGAHDLARAAVDGIDLGVHQGVHPRLGSLDVVPWVNLVGWPLRDGPLAVAQRDAFAGWAGHELQVPCFLYGPERSLPEVRRRAWRGLDPATGPSHPHPRAGAIAVGARGLLVAYNLWVGPPDGNAGCPAARLAAARAVAASIRGPAVRALGLPMSSGVQVSCNLVDPTAVGPAEVYDRVAAQLPIERAELVGLVPARVLDAIGAARWDQLDLAPARTIEARLEEAGLGPR